jgi:dephospho-CoA kinase
LADWRKRIDRIIVVTAPDELKIQRYAARIRASGAGAEGSLETIEADARNRLAHQVPEADKIAEADYVLDNSGGIESLRTQVKALWPRLKAESNKSG